MQNRQDEGRPPVRARRLRSALVALTPWAAWLAGMAVLTLVAVEHMLGGDGVVFVIAKATIYTTSLLTAVVTMGLVGLFAISGGYMLRYLEASAPAGRMAQALNRALWVVCAYVWIAVALLFVEPPAAVTAEELMTGDVDAMFAAIPAFNWLEKAGYGAVGVFLAVAVWRLSRQVRLLNAALAVGFGAATVVALVTVLNLVGGSMPELPS